MLGKKICRRLACNIWNVDCFLFARILIDFDRGIIFGRIFPWFIPRCFHLFMAGNKCGGGSLICDKIYYNDFEKYNEKQRK